MSLDKLNTFKDTKTIREENLAREVSRYKALSQELDKLKHEGEIEMENMKRKIDERNDKELKDFEMTA